MKAVRAGLGAALLSLAGCAGVGVSTDVDVGYAGGYYEPYGYDYGGWGAGYGVGPWHGHDHPGGFGHPGPGPRAPAFRPPGGGRSMPSLPSHGRGR